MHIITGLVIAGLASKMKKDKSLEGLPRFRTGPIQVAHAIRGRIRFVVPSLCGTDGDALSWIDEAQSLGGVKGVEVSTVTGSVVVTYDAASVDPPLLFGALARLLGLEDELERTPPPVLVRELRELGQSLNFAVYDKTGGMVDLWTLALIALAVVGAKKTMDSGWAALPAGFTLLWWALNSVSRRHEGAM